ncbi:MAG TPA: sulfite reductase subunit alpha, partial [Hyphomicrobiaceae bacterium]|nr:sulfite reductase subunit alpha [Hyphomicrobiaceae bacterium]
MGDLPATAANALSADDSDDAPWHDAALPLAERMTLAAGRPLSQQLFAAMAQQDCGQCGYRCATYAAALDAGSESKVNLCVPGGKDTSRTLKRLLQEFAEAQAPAAVAPEPVATNTVVGAAVGCGRDRPVEAIFRSATRLNAAGSAKDTHHVVLDIAG